MPTLRRDDVLIEGVTEIVAISVRIISPIRCGIGVESRVIALVYPLFMAVASKAKFAVVLLSSDDYGASRRQYDAEGVRDRALQFRARQNVVLELGFFYGRLGWENVFVVFEAPDEVFPNFERPSDLDGVIFDAMSDPAWKSNLQTRLAKAGFDIPDSA